MTQSALCPKSDTLKGLLKGDLPADEEARLTAHLDQCLSCQQTLEILAGGTFVPRSGLKPDHGPRPAFNRAFEKVKGELAETMEASAALGDGREPDVVFDPPSDTRFIGRLGVYDIVREIGRGGMGVVYEGYEPALQRSVAVKVLGPRLARDQRAHERFLREARAAALVVHENVVTIHAVGEANGTPYLVMEHVSGVSLQDRLDKEGPLNIVDVLRCGAQIAAGLAAAHGRGLIHRDIKPANILLERDSGKVKITDFGLAGVASVADDHQGEADSGQLRANLALSHAGHLAGTPQFMAPEQARGSAIDHRADLFSLGAVLYATCVGQSPSQGDNLPDLLKRVCESVPVSARNTRPEIPVWLDDLIMKLLAKNPAERPATAAEVAQLIGNHQAIAQFEAVVPNSMRRSQGREFRSRQQLGGWPLIHIATGIDPHTGRRRVAKGVIAVGDTAIGLVALANGMAIGGVALAGGMAVGLIGVAGGLGVGLLLALGGCAVGGLAVGGLALGFIALGGGAIGYFALGGGAWGAHPLGGNAQDPDAVAFFQNWLTSWTNAFSKR